MSKHRGKDTKLISLLLEKDAARKIDEERKRKDEVREKESQKELAKELETVEAALLRMESVLPMRVLTRETGILKNLYQKRIPRKNICKELKAKLKWESNVELNS